MPSLSINNDHGKSFTKGLATIEAYGGAAVSISSSNNIYTIAPSVAVTLSDTSLLSSQVAFQPSGIILSGMFRNVTTKEKKPFSYEMTLFAIVGNIVLLGGNSTLAAMGVTNPSQGDTIQLEFVYTLDGAYTAKGVRTSHLLS